VTIRTERAAGAGAGSEAVLERLKRLHPKRIDLSLDRMKGLLERLGHPERRLPPVVHIAGTNAKGSTCAYMKAALEAAGYGVHVYTSPHLVRFHERIALAAGNGPGCADAQPIAEAELRDLFIECEAANEGRPITYFEAATAAAFLAFSRHPADVVLLEVGLGGRLDATNVIAHPALCVLTPISIDHVQYLGDDLATIAFEKAGILKPRAPCVVAGQDAAVLRVIEARGADVAAPLIKFGADWRLGDISAAGFEVMAGGQSIKLPPPALPGRHQFDNAGLAVAALRNLGGFEVPDAALAQGLTGVRWPARLQRLGGGLAAKLPDGAELWLDGGHNPAAAQVLADTVRMWRARETGERAFYLVVGMMNVKDVAAFLAPFAGLASAVIGVKIPGEVNALSADEICRQARQSGLRTLAADDMAAAMTMIAQDSNAAAAAPLRVLICGSLYLAGSVLAAGQGAIKMPAELSG
jgi:dihydrofolate synthase/folylpolyglutamate synthase